MLGARPMKPPSGARGAVLAALQFLLDSLHERATVTVRIRDGPLSRFVVPPPEPDRTDGGGASCREALLDVLRDAGHRLTTEQIVLGLEQIGSLASQRTVERCLAQLRREHLVNNNQKD